MAQLSLTDIHKSFGDTKVIHGVDLEIADGEFTVFVGPSGCGKSTLLRMIAGLETVTSGAVAIGGADVTDAEPSERGVTMVFQSYALYPHMSVYNNMAFSLKMNGAGQDEIDRRVSAPPISSVWTSCWRGSRRRCPVASGSGRHRALDCSRAENFPV